MVRIYYQMEGIGGGGEIPNSRKKTKETIVGPYSMEEQSEIENSFQKYLKTVDISRNGTSSTEKGIKILAPKSAHGSIRDKKYIDPIVLTNGWDSGSSVVPYYVCADAPWPIGTGAGCYEAVNGIYTNNISSSPNFGLQYQLPCQPWHQGGSCYGFLWSYQIPATYPNEKACNDNCLYS